MNGNNEQSISLDRFLALSLKMLDDYFFRASKEKSRKLFKEIEAGKEVRVASLGFDNDREQRIHISLRLDHSEFQGHITFHLFRTALSMLLKELSQRLRAKGDLRVFTSENTGEMMFFIPGIVEDRDKVNFLVLVLARGEGSNARLKLQFLDPEQFRKKPTGSDAQDSQQASVEPEVLGESETSGKEVPAKDTSGK